MILVKKCSLSSREEKVERNKLEPHKSGQLFSKCKVINRLRTFPGVRLEPVDMQQRKAKLVLSFKHTGPRVTQKELKT